MEDITCCSETRNLSSSVENISRVSPPFEPFYDEFKVTKCCTKTFCLCCVLRSKIAFMRCVTFERSLRFWIIHE